MASAIEDVSGLPGQKVVDQEGVEIGEVKDIYAVGENEPMYVTIEASTGMRDSKVVFVPLARLKEENEEISVPYSAAHIKKSPQIEVEDELSEEDDRTLRDYYAIDHADQELRTDNDSYAARVPEGDAPAKKTSADDVKDPGSGEDGSENEQESPKGEGSEDAEEGEGSDDPEKESEDDSEEEDPKGQGSKGEDSDDGDSEEERGSEREGSES